MNKMYSLIFFILICSVKSAFPQSVYMSESGRATFFSKAPLENIDATTENVNSFINITNNEIVFIIPIKSFKFKKSLMQEHFNEKYIESDRYPNAQYKGKILENIDFAKDSSYVVTCTGALTLHGVEKVRTDHGKIEIKNGKISLTAEFNVACADHNIEIPKLVIQNIASVVNVTLNANYIPYKKNENK